MLLNRLIFLYILCLCALVFLPNVFWRNIKLEPIEEKKMPFRYGEIHVPRDGIVRGVTFYLEHSNGIKR